ncbi:hypothetical protein NDU88_003148 [Pleurodeles waltl]|uniref:Uncharacterized protein n=1 Tax=Pleurodeles waltl TaxID=8319 RepID=A0AAV7M3J2_PLEWA|nr:hypothetical protein NDU88_003148 [Pleurodeles waltl]
MDAKDHSGLVKSIRLSGSTCGKKKNTPVDGAAASAQLGDPLDTSLNSPSSTPSFFFPSVVFLSSATLPNASTPGRVGGPFKHLGSRRDGSGML